MDDAWDEEKKTSNYRLKKEYIPRKDALVTIVKVIDVSLSQTDSYFLYANLRIDFFRVKVSIFIAIAICVYTQNLVSFIGCLQKTFSIIE